MPKAKKVRKPGKLTLAKRLRKELKASRIKNKKELREIESDLRSLGALKKKKCRTC